MVMARSIPARPVTVPGSLAPRDYNRPMTAERPVAAHAPAATAATGDPNAPGRIHADRAAGSLEIEWRDGHGTRYDAITLRWLCPCAYCRGEAGMPGWLDSAPTLTPEQTRLVDLQLVGQYALAPTWGDGHHTGYYAFTTLRDMCPCDACSTGRATAGRPTIGRPNHATHTGGEPR
jgi:DUF971 family protein